MPLNESALSAAQLVGGNTLVVVLHAFTKSPKDMSAVISEVKANWPDSDVLCPDLDAKLWSTRSANEVVCDVLALIDERCAETIFGSIVLIGHSLGALLARKTYVVACGETWDAPFETAFKIDGEALTPPRPWASKVCRVILLSGINRGWRISHHLNLVKAPLWWAGVAASNLINLVTLGRKKLLISTIRQGAEFITQLRIQWIRMRQASVEPGRAGGAATVQLLGSTDDMVAPEDNVDLVSGGDFFYIDVPYSGHSSVIELDHPEHGAERRRVFSVALIGGEHQLRSESMLPSDVQFAKSDVKIKNVLFVIHGIRDAGYWTHKVARRVKRRAGGDAGEWATETSSYGYFPMLPFLFPWYRRQKVEWLMDQYTEALARYPRAKFYYVGHSNGTYLVSSALDLYPSCRFEHIAFAGSVVSRRYDWARHLQAPRPAVKSVLNFVASRDWVVAFFPKFFQTLGFQDLGSAGHDGFDDAGSIPEVRNLLYIRGGHGAAIDEALWDVIAEFVIEGAPLKHHVPKETTKQVLWVKTLGLFPPVVWTAAATILVCVWLVVQCTLQKILGGHPSTGFVTGFAFASYLLLLWLALTRI